MRAAGPVVFFLEGTLEAGDCLMDVEWRGAESGCCELATGQGTGGWISEGQSSVVLFLNLSFSNFMKILIRAALNISSFKYLKWI